MPEAATPAPPPGLAVDPEAVKREKWARWKNPREVPYEDAPIDGPVLLRVKFEGGPGWCPTSVSVDLVLDGADSEKRRCITVRMNREPWEARIVQAETYDVVLAIVDGEVSDQKYEGLVPDAEGAVAITLYESVESTLEVVDEGSQAPIPEARAIPVGARVGGTRSKPYAHLLDLLPEASTLSASADGRIALPASSAADEWWVVAPGHITAKVRVPPTSTPLRVPLERGGALRIEVTGWPDLVGAVLELRRRVPGPDDNEFDSAFDAIGALPEDWGHEYSADGLEPGTWTVAVTLGEDRALEDAFAVQEVEVVAGRTATLRLVVPAQTDAGGFDATIEVTPSPGWDEPPTTVTLDGESERNRRIRVTGETPQGAGKGPWLFSCRGLRNGPYHLTVGPYPWAVHVWLGAGDPVVRVTVPAPVDLRVRVVDAESGAVLSSAWVWGTLATAELASDEARPRLDTGHRRRGWSSPNVGLEPVPGDNVHAARLPAGSVTVYASAPRYVGGTADVRLEEGTPTETTIRLARDPNEWTDDDEPSDEDD